MNDIVKPLTKDGMVGWDKNGQLWAWQVEGNGRSGTIIGDPRGHKCSICLQGWEITVESLKDQYYWDNRAEWAHQTCYIRFLALQEYEFWVGALVGAGFIFGPVDNPKTTMDSGPALDSLPNEYWGPKDPWGAGSPWYRARLLKKISYGNNVALGRTLKLGYRKRVYVLEIEEGTAPYDTEAAKRLFAKENVTKEIGTKGMMTHAWGRDKAREYLRHFAEILGVKKE